MAYLTALFFILFETLLP